MRRGGCVQTRAALSKAQWNDDFHHIVHVLLTERARWVLLELCAVHARA